MVSSVMSKIVGILIFLLIFIIIGIAWYGPEGFFNKVKGVTSTIAGYVPNATLGATELQGTAPQYAPGVASSLSSLKATIDSMIQYPHSNCFIKFEPLPDLIGTGAKEGEKVSNILSFTLTGEETIVQVKEGGRILQSETWKFKPCIIAGKGSSGQSIAENFYHNFLRENSKCSGCILKACLPNEECKLPYWGIVSQIYFTYGSGWFTADGNKITFGIPEAETDNNFLNGGYLFKPSPGFVCFFPTKYGDILGNCDGAGVYGLDDDCLTDETEEESIPYNLKHAQLNYCY